MTTLTLVPENVRRNAVFYEPLFDDTQVPARQTKESAGYDLHAYISGRTIKVMTDTNAAHEVPVAPGDALLLYEGERALIPLGFKAQLPQGYEAQIRIRSSAAFKKGLVIPNAPGTIDADYPDEWLVMLRNDTKVPVRIEHGERIAQAVIAPYATYRWAPGTVGVTTDRTGGVGSTGQ